MKLSAHSHADGKLVMFITFKILLIDKKEYLLVRFITQVNCNFSLQQKTFKHDRKSNDCSKLSKLVSFKNEKEKISIKYQNH